MAATQQMAIRMTMDASSVNADLSQVMREFERFGDALSRSASQASDAQQQVKASAEQGAAAIRSLFIESVKGFEDGKLSFSTLIEQGGSSRIRSGASGLRSAQWEAMLQSWQLL